MALPPYQFALACTATKTRACISTHFACVGRVSSCVCVGCDPSRNTLASSPRVVMAIRKRVTDEHSSSCPLWQPDVAVAVVVVWPTYVLSDWLAHCVMPYHSLVLMIHMCACCAVPLARRMPRQWTRTNVTSSDRRSWRTMKAQPHQRSCCTRTRSTTRLHQRCVDDPNAATLNRRVLHLALL